MSSYLAYVASQPRFCGSSWAPYPMFLEPRIINERLYTRTQYWLFFITDEQVFDKVYEHFDPKKKDGKDRYNVLLRCRFAHLRDGVECCIMCDGLVHCSDCSTELIIETKLIKGKGHYHYEMASMQPYFDSRCVQLEEQGGNQSR